MRYSFCSKLVNQGLRKIRMLCKKNERLTGFGILSKLTPHTAAASVRAIGFLTTRKEEVCAAKTGKEVNLCEIRERL